MNDRRVLNDFAPKLTTSRLWAIARDASLYLNSLRYSLGVQPVILRKATLNELV